MTPDDDSPTPTTPTPTLDERPSIHLDDVLKLAGIATTGGQAKRLIQGGEVKVNGRVETHRKRAVHAGDEIEVGDDSFTVELEEFEYDDEDDEDDASDVP